MMKLGGSLLCSLLWPAWVLGCGDCDPTQRPDLALCALRPTPQSISVVRCSDLVDGRASVVRITSRDGRAWRAVSAPPPRPPTMGPHGRPCPWTVPKIRLSRADAVALRPHLRQGWEMDQSVEACEREGEDVVWFGIAFYEGEGSDGTGGIGRYDARSRLLEVRRPAALRDVSVDRLARDGDRLWLATSSRYECQTIPRGLVRYDWGKDEVVDFAGKDDGPCGFAMNGLAVWQGGLWAATDLGLSRMDLAAETWEHFVIAGDGARLKPTTCESLVGTVAVGIRGVAAEGWSDECALTTLAGRFRPRLMEEILEKKPAATWDCNDVRFLASRAAGVPALRRMARTPGLLECAVEGYGSTGRRDPGWRDWLLEIHGKGSSAAARELARFRGDGRVVRHFAARLGTGRFAFREPEHLVDVQGAQSVATLMEALAALPLRAAWGTEGAGTLSDCTREGSVLTALERAARRIIKEDGTVLRLPRDSDEPGWEDTRPCGLPSMSRRWCALDVTQKEAFRRRWLAWWQRKTAGGG